jgi:hypothetical protein
MEDRSKFPPGNWPLHWPEDAVRRVYAVQELLKACVVAMKRWAAEEDGLPAEQYIGAFQAVEKAEKVIGPVTP